MHLKCIYELCIILLIFQSYLHHIRVILLFYIGFGDNSQFPHLFGINPPEPENPFFFLYLFQDLNDVIISYKFRRVIILEGEDLGVKEVNERRPEDQKGGPTRVLYLAAWAHPTWPLWPRLHRSFAQKHPRDLKTPI